MKHIAPSYRVLPSIESVSVAKLPIYTQGIRAEIVVYDLANTLE